MGEMYLLLDFISGFVCKRSNKGSSKDGMANFEHKPCSRSSIIIQGVYFVWQLSFIISCRDSVARVGCRLSGLKFIR
jgi:hypothetical protein